MAALCVLAPLFCYLLCRKSCSLLPSPQPPLELLWASKQDVFPGPEGQVSDRTQALFKALSGAALKCCSDRLSAQDTHSAVGSWGSHSLSSSLQSHRV